MNIKTLKKPDPRIDIRYLSNLGIQAYNIGNLYPQHVRDIVNASPTGKLCFNKYAKFIEGNGLNNKSLADFVVNRKGQTLSEIHHLLSSDIAYGGVSLHVNYNVAGNIVEMQYEPFENCRLEEEDDAGIVGNIIVHPDWRGKKTRSGKTIKVSLDTIEYVPVFNPDKNVIQAQMERFLGVENYPGQMLWASINGVQTYPTPKFDNVLTEMSTEEGLSNTKHRDVRNNFLPSGMLVSFTGQSAPDVDGDTGEDNGYTEALAQFQGDTNSFKIMDVEVGSSEEIPQFIKFEAANADKRFTETNASTIENIYAAFGQEVFLCIRNGKIGFSGDIVADAWRDYAMQVTEEQRMLSTIYKKIFSHWEPTEIAIELLTDFSIQPCVYGGVESNKKD